MMIIGVDYHPSFQTIAFLMEETGEYGEQELNHSDGEAERFYRELKERGVSVRVGMEATGHARWFERLLAELGFELWIGDPAEIKTKRVRKQKTDREDARLMLKLLRENRFPKIWVPSPENRDAPYAALAMVYASWVPGANRPRDRMPKAREFALKALSLDSGVTDAHYSLGAVALFYDWDWTTAEKEFQRELELNPNHVLAHEWRARALVTCGKTEEAVAEAKLSLGLSPAVTDWDYPTWVFILARRYDLARERAQEMVDLEPNFPWGHFELAQVYEHEGRPEDGAREFLRAYELLGTDRKELEKLKRAITKDGAKGYWGRTVENYRESAKSEYVPPVLMAMACVRIGDKQCAFDRLERGFQERDDLMVNLKVEPVFDGLREDQRFQALVRRVGIP